MSIRPDLSMPIVYFADCFYMTQVLKLKSDLVLTPHLLYELCSNRFVASYLHSKEVEKTGNCCDISVNYYGNGHSIFTVYPFAIDV